MAMITCKDCRKQFSSSASSCPHCGWKRPSGCRRVMFGGLVVFGLFAALIGFVIGPMFDEQSQAREQARRAAMSPEQRAEEDRRAEAARDAQRDERQLTQVRYACRRSLLNSLNDPSSAQLGSPSVWPMRRLDDGSVVVVIEGRAKNAFGAYIRGTWECHARRAGGTYELTGLVQTSP